MLPLCVLLQCPACLLYFGKNIIDTVFFIVFLCCHFIILMISPKISCNEIPDDPRVEEGENKNWNNTWKQDKNDLCKKFIFCNSGYWNKSKYTLKRKSGCLFGWYLKVLKSLCKIEYVM